MYFTERTAKVKSCGIQRRSAPRVSDITGMSGQFDQNRQPNPTDMVCTGWDEARIRRIINGGLHACRNGFVHINLKDIETVQGDVSRLTRWTDIVRNIIEEL